MVTVSGGETGISGWKCLQVKNFVVHGICNFQKALSSYTIDNANCYNALQSNIKHLNLQTSAAIQENTADVATLEEIENAEKAWKKTVKDLALPKDFKKLV